MNVLSLIFDFVRSRLVSADAEHAERVNRARVAARRAKLDAAAYDELLDEQDERARAGRQEADR